MPLSSTPTTKAESARRLVELPPLAHLNQKAERLNHPTQCADGAFVLMDENEDAQTLRFVASGHFSSHRSTDSAHARYGSRFTGQVRQFHRVRSVTGTR